jgi:hypothetical protein
MVKEWSDKRKPVGWKDKEKLWSKSDRYIRKKTVTSKPDFLEPLKKWENSRHLL